MGSPVSTMMSEREVQLFQALRRVAVGQLGEEAVHALAGDLGEHHRHFQAQLGITEHNCP